MMLLGSLLLCARTIRTNYAEVLWSCLKLIKSLSKMS